MTEFVTLDGYFVDITTDKAVLLKHKVNRDATWVPRSVCEAGERLSMHDVDIVVKKWFADKEGLEY